MEFRVSVKRAVSIYWLNYRPFTLYADEWKAIFDTASVVRRFIATCHPELSCRCSADVCEALRSACQRGEFGSESRHGLLWCRRASTGAVSVYGLRRFPITLYCGQWLRVLDARADIEAFIRDNENGLERKGCTVPPQPTLAPRPRREVVGTDNIIRPSASLSGVVTPSGDIEWTS